LLNSHGRIFMYRFGGTIHALQQIRPITENQHNFWHKNKKVVRCGFCFPPAEPEPQPPVEQTELLNEVFELPQPEVKPIPPPKVEPEDLEPEPQTSMALAFQRINRR